MRIISFFILWIFSLSTLNAQKFEDVFRKECDKSYSFLKKNEKIIKKKLIDYSGKEIEIISIIFPELARYNEVKDFAETSFLELLYVNYGESKANFSIGNFQMKPSFLEAVEKYSKIYLPKRYKRFIYIIDDVKGIRNERVERMKNLDWQLYYLLCFYEIMIIKFEISKESSKYIIEFCSTAYNWGFEATKEKILTRQKIKTFPYGSKASISFAYSEIAYDFYSKNRNMFD
jgi:hypothetical protein